MKCPNCKFQNPEGIKFCGECGSKLEKTCPECKFLNPPQFKFCGRCGYGFERQDVESSKINYKEPQSYTPKHLAEKILTTRSSIEGERKIVTVMFADVAGFTFLSENLDPEDVHEIMNGCFKILMDEIHLCEGTINQFTGDGVMALFGAPIAHEDHAQRACYAALAIQRALVLYGNKLKKDYGIDFKMRIGLNSGAVVVGAIGDDLRMDYTAQGDTANLASRMEGMAQAGTVQVAEQTCRLVGDAFEFEPLGQVPVKGKEKPVAVYRLKDKAFKARVRSEREVYSEMVGRDQELARLELQILKAVNGEGSVVNVVGEAGIGKSRLMAELTKREVVKRVMLLEGRAISMGKNLSFHPIIDLLKNWAHIREDDGESAAMNKLEEAIRRVSVEEADEIFPFVATLMGMKLSGKYAERIKGIEGEALEKLIFKNVRELLIRSTEIIPVVIVIEDLHWADTSTLILIDALYRLSRTQKVVFINVFRPGYWENEDKTPANLKERTADLLPVELVLQPLDVQSSETLINNMLSIKGLHHGVKTRIIERAGGNPFFIEEVVRGLIDEGAVIVKDDGFEVTDKIHSVVIPPTISDVLMARIDRLDEESRNVVKVASVIGRSFFYRILADVVSLVDSLDDKLAYLKQIQLIRERIQMNELEYLFKHALAQEAAYESTLLQQRKQLHLKVAESIERLFSERLHEFYGILAMHYSRADNLSKAEEYIEKAGEEAMRSSASSEALNYLQEALKLYMDRSGKNPEAKKLMQYKKNLAQAYLARGNFSEAADHFQEILNNEQYSPFQSKLPPTFRLGKNFFAIGLKLYLPFIFKKKLPDPMELEFLDIFYNKVSCLVHIDSRQFFIALTSATNQFLSLDIYKIEKGLNWLSGGVAALYVSGLLSVGRKLLELMENIFEVQNIACTSKLAAGRVLHSIHLGPWKIEPKFDAGMIDRELKNGEVYYVTAYLLHMGVLNIEMGLFDEAERCQQKLYEIIDAFGYNFARVHYHFVKANHLLKTGKFHKAAIEIEDGYAIAGQTSMNPSIIRFLGIKIILAVLLGQTETAISLVKDGDRLLSETRFMGPLYLAPFFLGRLLTHIALLKDALRSGNQPEILKVKKTTFQSACQAEKNSRRQVLYKTWILRSIGVYYRLINNQGQALKWWDKAIKEGERLGARPDLSRTYLEVGKRLQEPQSKYKELNGISAPEYLDKAETLFREMDLQWDLEQLEQIRMGHKEQIAL